MLPAAAALLWLLFALAAAALVRNPRREPLAGLALALIRLYARHWHRLRIEGAEHIPTSMHPGPLVVVCNHTAGVDPLLVQAAARFEVRWMMARDMMPAPLAGLWAWIGVIPVNRSAGDTTAARQALRHLESRGVLGIFPEGGIERPPRTVLPFQPGVGLIIHRSGAPVLQVIIDGVPPGPTAWSSLLRRSPRGATVRFLPIHDYRSSRLAAAAIADDLRARLIAHTGWPAADRRGPHTQA